MSWMIDDDFNITMTRGDTPSFVVDVNIKDDDGELHPYTPKEGDEIVFALRKKGGEEVNLIKVVPADSLEFTLEESDTKNLDIGTYSYEISLNSGDYHCTFIERKKLKLTDEIY